MQLAPVVHLRFTRHNLFEAAHARCRQWGIPTDDGKLQQTCVQGRGRIGGREQGEESGSESETEDSREEVKESADGRRSVNVSIVVVWGGVTSGEFLHTGRGGERLVPANLNRGAGYMRM